MTLVNGQPQESISVKDRSFQYGDGCFTTMRTKNGEVQNWPLHIERMQSCMDVLGINSPDWKRVKSWLDRAALPESFAGLKLHISRGDGGRGYSPKGVDEPVITISAFAFPQHYYDWREHGIELGVCEKKMGLNPLLAGHKHNNRLEQVLFKAEADKAGVADAVVLDINDHVIETTMANLFWVKGNRLYTPSLDMSGVAGVIRRLIKQGAKQKGLNMVCGQFELEQLDNAEEVFISNSILGVAPVIKIGDKRFNIGQVTRSFQENYNS